MTWARSGERAPRIFRAGHILDGHGLFPVGPVAIFDAQGDRSADRLAVADAGQRFDAVFFDLLAAAAPVAELPPVQLPLQEIKIDRHTRRHAADPCDQRLTVRLSRCDEAKHRRQRILSDPARRVKPGNLARLGIPKDVRCGPRIVKARSVILRPAIGRYATKNIRFTQQGFGCIKMLIRAVKTQSLGVPVAGPRNDPGVDCETQFAIVMHGG